MRKRRRKIVRNHPFLPTGRYLYYRYVMANKLGRKLRREEHVHHINGKEDDDRPSNLMVVSASEHARITMTGRKRSKRTKRRISRGNRGQVRSSETRAKISKANKGKIWSEERKRQHSAAMYKHFEAHPKEAPTGRPWLKLKVSRRTWYRWKRKITSSRK